jgi:hypothetical protein
MVIAVDQSGADPTKVCEDVQAIVHKVESRIIFFHIWQCINNFGAPMGDSQPTSCHDILER